MEEIEFNFETNEYLLFLNLRNKRVNIGIIELEKSQVKNKNEQYLKSIATLDYNVLDKLERKVNSKALIKVVNFINESSVLYCDTKMRKDFIEQNIRKNKFDTDVIFKINL